MRLYTILKAIADAMPRIKEATVGDQYSIYIKFIGMYICAGRNSIQPSAAKTLTGKTISFPVTFGAQPYVFCSITGGPEVDVCRITASNITKTNFIAYIFASNTTNRSFNWLAIGWA